MKHKSQLSDCIRFNTLIHCLMKSNNMQIARNTCTIISCRLQALKRSFSTKHKVTYNAMIKNVSLTILDTTSRIQVTKSSRHLVDASCTVKNGGLENKTQELKQPVTLEIRPDTHTVVRNQTKTHLLYKTINIRTCDYSVRKQTYHIAITKLAILRYPLLCYVISSEINRNNKQMWCSPPS